MRDKMFPFSQNSNQPYNFRSPEMHFSFYKEKKKCFTTKKTITGLLKICFFKMKIDKRYRRSWRKLPIKIQRSWRWQWRWRWRWQWSRKRERLHVTLRGQSRQERTSTTLTTFITALDIWKLTGKYVLNFSTILFVDVVIIASKQSFI